MARGGVRANAGRKVGSLGAKSREIAERCIKDGLTPLEVLLDNMTFYHQASVKAIERLLDNGVPQAEGGSSDQPHADVVNALREVLALRKLAADAAEKAAPYVHPRLSSYVDDDAGDEEWVPLAERLAAYQRRDDIAAAGDKVVELKGK